MLHKIVGVELDDFTLGYLTCALWSSHDDREDADGEMLDANFTIEDFAPETLRQAIADCEKFQRENAALLESAFNSPDYRRVNDSTPEQTAGHDFWLTRNGHGAGFWDGDYPKQHGEQLTTASEAYGDVDLYVGEDGKIWS